MKKALLTTLTLLIFSLLLVSLPNGANAEFIGYDKVLNAELLSGNDVDVIVTLSSGRIGNRGDDDLSFMSSIEQQRKVIDRLSKDSGSVGLQLQNLPIFSANVTQKGIKELASMNEVQAIEKNWPLQLFTAQGIPLMSSGDARKSAGGSGVAIAIVDSGINYDHPALGGPGFPNKKIIGGYDFAEDDKDPMEGSDIDPRTGESAPSTHGTSCAGIAAGLNTNIEGDYIGGVAPEAKLYALKVQESSGAISTMAILKAWDWAITHQNDDPGNPIMIISASIGNPRFQASNYCDNRFPSYKRVTDELTSKGIALFVSSGNEGQMNSIASPACLKNTISVGAVYDTSTDQATIDRVTYYSNSSEILDILAPSEQASTPSSPGNIYTDHFNGTSAAAPYAAGAAALIQSQHKKQHGRFLSVSALKKIMMENGDLVLDDKSGIQTPRVNVAKSIAAFSSSDKKTHKVAKKAPSQAPQNKRQPTKKSFAGSLFIDEDDGAAENDSGSTTIIGY